MLTNPEEMTGHQHFRKTTASYSIQAVVLRLCLLQPSLILVPEFLIS